MKIQKPSDTQNVSLVGSSFQNSETETVVSNILFVLRKMDQQRWVPFSWDDYKKHCIHSVSEAERGVIFALTNGGQPVANTTAHLDSGYLSENGGNYLVTQKLLDVIEACGS